MLFVRMDGLISYGSDEEEMEFEEVPKTEDKDPIEETNKLSGEIETTPNTEISFNNASSLPGLTSYVSYSPVHSLLNLDSKYSIIT